MFRPTMARFSTSILSKRLNMIFLGPPGVGKGSISEAIGPIFGLPLISTGQMIRTEIKNQSNLGKEVKSIIERGELVGDDIVVAMCDKRLAMPDCSKGFILDGFPRRISQANALAKITPIDLVVNLTLDFDVLIAKTCSRRVCDGCGKNYNLANIQRPDLGISMGPLLPKVEGVCDKCSGPLVQRADDIEQVVWDRLRVYHDATAPLIDYYQEQNKLMTFQILKGMKDLPAVQQAIQKRVDKL